MSPQDQHEPPTQTSPVRARPPGLPRLGLGQRVLAMGLAGGFLAVLVTASLLTPNAEGHGTHTQLGMPACAWAAALNRPCPTCGMTTSFAHAAHGQYLAAARTQPMGFLLSLGAAVGFWFAGHAAATGSRLDLVLGGLLRPKVLWTAVGLAALAWVYKLLTWQ